LGSTKLAAGKPKLLIKFKFADDFDDWFNIHHLPKIRREEETGISDQWLEKRARISLQFGLWSKKKETRLQVFGGKPRRWASFLGSGARWDVPESEPDWITKKASSIL